MTSAGFASMLATGMPQMLRWTYLIRPTTTPPHPTGKWSKMAPLLPGRPPRAWLAYRLGADDVRPGHTA